MGVWYLVNSDGHIMFCQPLLIHYARQPGHAEGNIPTVNNYFSQRDSEFDDRRLFRNPVGIHLPEPRYGNGND